MKSMRRLLIQFAALPAAAATSVKVFIRAGQSNTPAHGHHWRGHAESYFLIGDALGGGDEEPFEVSLFR